MGKTKFFTEQVTGGSRGEASDEDMQREFTHFGAEEIPDDSTFFMPEGGGGFVGRAKGWEPRPIGLDIDAIAAGDIHTKTLCGPRGSSPPGTAPE